MLTLHDQDGRPLFTTACASLPEDVRSWLFHFIPVVVLLSTGGAQAKRPWVLRDLHGCLDCGVCLR